MEAVVVVGVVPAQRLRRNVALFVAIRHIFDRPDGRLAHARIVGMQLPIPGHNVSAAVSTHEMRHQTVAVIRPDCGDLQTERVHAPHALAA